MNSQFFRQVDRDTWIALLCLAVGWFFLATVVTTLGPLQQKYHFFDMLTVMLNPAWLLYGMGSSHPFEAVVFGLIDLAVLVLPLVPYLARKRSAWLLHGTNIAFSVDSPPVGWDESLVRHPATRR